VEERKMKDIAKTLTEIEKLEKLTEERQKQLDKLQNESNEAVKQIQSLYKKLQSGIEKQSLKFGTQKKKQASSNSISLKDAVLAVLKMKPNQKVVEIRKMIFEQNLWSSESKTANSQVNVAVTGLFKTKQLKRDKEKRYTIVGDKS
jgi:hypothetical protein